MFLDGSFGRESVGKRVCLALISQLSVTHSLNITMDFIVVQKIMTLLVLVLYYISVT